jgi:pilus assembly protein CpaB
MNPRQRRGTLLTALATLGSIVVFIAITGYVGSIRTEVGERTQVLVLTRAVSAYAPIDQSTVRRIEVPRRWTPRTVITSIGEVAGKVAAADLPKGSYLQQGMLVGAPALKPGQREIAILIDAETGVAGKVHPGMLVDIYATFQPQQQPAQSRQAQRSCAVRVIGGARVIQTGALTERAERGGTDVNQVVPITFALSTQDSLKLTYAESFAVKVRLALIGEGQDYWSMGLGSVCKAPVAR